MSDAELALRILLSLLFGTLVGIERQWHHKNAGLKTNTLVAIGAAAFALISQHGFGPNSNPAQVAAGVVTGIGFIGGGVIMRRGGSVQGINSAATLWATASMGLAIGTGYYTLAGILLAAVLAIQFLLRSAANWIDRRSGLINPQNVYGVSVTFEETARESLYHAWSDFTARNGISIINCIDKLEGANKRVFEATMGLSDARAREMPHWGEKLSRIAGVISAKWSRKDAGAED